jgi:hypothetical protein
MRLDAFTATVYERIDSLMRPEKPAQLRDLRQAILKKSAADEVLAWLERFLRLEYRHASAKPAEAVEQLVKAARLPDAVLTEFRKRSQHEFVRAWQVIGPFASASAGPEKDGVHLDREHDGLAGKVRWKPHDSATDRIDVSKVLLPQKPGAVYLACWIHSEKARPALLQVGSQDGVKVWVNSRKKAKPVLEESETREASPAQDSARIELSAGWNEVLVRVDSGTGRAALFFELREVDNTGPAKGLRFQSRLP